MTNKKNSKRIKMDKYETEEQVELKQFIKILVVLIILVVGVYFLTRAFVTKDLFNKKEESSETTKGTINYSTTGKITDSNAGSPVQLADGSGDQTFTTEDFGLEQFEQMVIENNTIKSVRKGGVTLTYDPTTGEVTSSK